VNKRLAVLALSIAWVSACSMSPTMNKVPPKDTDLTGDWALERHASDDVRARLAPLMEKRERKWRSLERRFEDDAPVRGPDAELPPEATHRGGQQEPTTIQWVRQQRQHAADELIAFVSPATKLEIRQSMQHGHQEISVHNDKQEGTRVLAPGETSALFNSMGSFDLSSGWQKTRFVVDMRGTEGNSMHIIQYYTLLESDTVLEMNMEAYLPELGKQKFRFVYKRGL
jgi:hypothetical protein